MPICPKCSATIHAGADDRCPACGYSLQRADAIFGRGQVEFTRVLDSAGVLTHPERLELMNYLADIERNISPVALGVYLTDDGRATDFRTHAHWILNHAHIHHPSFGRRQTFRAVEDAELRELAPGERIVPELPPSLLQRTTKSIRTFFRDWLHPLPPPVRQEWMLILVLDVQLEMACFSWGYMLDPYINPDSINSCIIQARLSFREREMLTGLKKVMKSAVRRIAADSHKITRSVNPYRYVIPASILTLTLGTPFQPLHAETVAVDPETESIAVDPEAIPTESIAVDPETEVTPTASEAIAVDPDIEAGETAAVPPSTGVTNPESAANSTATDLAGTGSTPNSGTKPPSPPAAPTPPDYPFPANWTEEDYRPLMAGELSNAYSLLLPKVQYENTLPKKDNRSSRLNIESDQQVPAHYVTAYTQPPPHSLLDPQHLLSTTEREDLIHVLRQANAHSTYRINVVLFKAGQEISPELSTANLITPTSIPCEYTVLISYRVGAPSQLELGYQEISPGEDQRHRWLLAAREAAVKQGSGVESIMAAIRSVQQSLEPLAANFHPITPDATYKVPLLDLPMKAETGEKKIGIRDRIEMWCEEHVTTTGANTAGSIILLILLSLIVRSCRKNSGKLVNTEPDVRLSSPYGAGVSRHVRYLEGKEAKKEKRLF